jgi:acyl-CoA synthetase (AMP-forming)/AMP-acid ligase II
MPVRLFSSPLVLKLRSVANTIFPPPFLLLFFHGNTPASLLVSGYKVYPSVVDEILYRHPAVALVATIGVPDRERAGSERAKAIVQLKDNYKEIVTAV